MINQEKGIHQNQFTYAHHPFPFFTKSRYHSDVPADKSRSMEASTPFPIIHYKKHTDPQQYV
jgi:hypothetical protein